MTGLLRFASVFCFALSGMVFALAVETREVLAAPSPEAVSCASCACPALACVIRGRSCDSDGCICPGSGACK